MKTTRIKISGAVQGVFFRNFIKEEADKIGVRGHVRNLDTGEVEVLAEGSPKEVESMINICKKGAPQSKVRDIDIQEIGHIGFEDFRILNI
jgi:acylphosphatase